MLSKFPWRSVVLQSEASADAATTEAATKGNAALAQAAGTASNPPDLPTANGHLPSANGLTPAAQKAIPNGQDLPPAPGTAPLKGVPALPQCRVKVMPEGNESVASQIRQSESQRPSATEAEYRDAEGMYSPEQPFWGVLSNARALSSLDSDRQVSLSLLTSLRSDFHYPLAVHSFIRSPAILLFCSLVLFSAWNHSF